MLMIDEEGSALSRIMIAYIDAVHGVLREPCLPFESDTGVDSTVTETSQTLQYPKTTKDIEFP